MATRKRKHYKLAFAGEIGMCEIDIRQDHHAESILRALIHSGFAVNIREFDKLVEVEDYEDEKCAVENCEVNAVEQLASREMRMSMAQGLGMEAVPMERPSF